MELNAGGACRAVSQDLLLVEGGAGIHETLLLNSKNKKSVKSQTVWVPRSSLLDRVQSFLPHMANANDELRREMERGPVVDFDIEHVEASTENVIEMNVALVELSGSSTEEEDSASEEDSDDSSVCEEVTVDNIKLPKSKGEGRIEVLDTKSNE
ncbi:NOP protein chaperone 1 isoform X2 [Heteronotia binoei]|uniref:NOP protein chaperone 1 isoform X2 n=1 Tax=Heteronotia binoei TaxID=13085 RepID=UPI0029301A1A|nr:NOP protein chaperone 1 isoform X2 [Heteronotia binoei]